jgi:DNA-binding winged helix-turn-helix (wHTH) protein
MSGPPDELVLLEIQGNVLAMVFRGKDTSLGPLEGEVLRLLARQAPGPVAREQLAECLELSLEALYRTIYRLRRRLGSQAIQKVGQAVTRDGRARGFSGYRLALPTRSESLLSPR